LPRFFFAVKALIPDGDLILIVRRSERARGHHGLWELPGGRLEFGETPEEAIVREVREEAGLEIRESVIRSFR